MSDRNTLSVWYDSGNCAITEDERIGAAMVGGHLGDDPPETMTRANPYDIIAIYCHPDTLTPCAIGEGVRIKLRADEWVKAKGRGYLASEDE